MAARDLRPRLWVFSVAQQSGDYWQRATGTKWRGCRPPIFRTADRPVVRNSAGGGRPRTGAGAGLIPSPPAVAKGFPAGIGDRDRVLQFDEAATRVRDRRLDRDDHARLK